MAENIENNGCSQRDNAEHEGYVKASRSFNRIWKEKEGKRWNKKKFLLVSKKKVEKVKELRPIDDVFFEVLADDIPFCQEMLRILIEDENLVVKDVILQSSQRNLYGRSVRLDALCILGNGKNAMSRFSNQTMMIMSVA